MPAASPLGVSVKEALDAVPGVAEHPNGHSENLLRYLAPTGAPFAVGRAEQKAVRFWVLDEPAFRTSCEIAGIAFEVSPPKSKGVPGRSSNLDQVSEFKRRHLLWSRVSEPAQALSLLGLLVAASSPREGAVVPPSPPPEPGAAVEMPEPTSHIGLDAEASGRAREPAPADASRPTESEATPLEPRAEAPVVAPVEPAPAVPPSPPAEPPAQSAAPGARPEAIPAAPPPSPAPRRSLLGRLLGGLLGGRGKRS